MDYVVTLPRSFLGELRGFVNRFGAKCRDCHYRSYDNCRDCPANGALELIAKIDSHPESVKMESYLHKSPFLEHLACVISAIREAGRPIFQREMRIPGMTRQSLFWDLKKMVQRGYLMRVGTQFGVAYKIGPKKFQLPQ